MSIEELKIELSKEIEELNDEETLEAILIYLQELKRLSRDEFPDDLEGDPPASSFF